MNLRTNFASNQKNGLLLKAMMLLLTVCVVMGSCKKDDEESEDINSDCYISSVSLGQMKRAIYYGEDGDSVGYVTFSAGAIPMIIDQRTNTIKNSILLPSGAMLNQVKMEVGHSGVLSYRCEGGEEVPFSSEDSIDCTKPVTFIVYSSDGSSRREYTLVLSVDKNEGNKFAWTRVEATTYLNEDTVRRMVVASDGALVMLGCTKDGIVSRYKRGKADQKWSNDPIQYAEGANGATDLDIQTLTLSPEKDKFLMNTLDGAQMVESTDGLNWTNKESAEGKRIVGSTSTRIYAICDSLLYSKALGEEWKQETTDAQKDFTPLHDVHLIEMALNSGYTRLMLIGYGKKDGAEPAIVWSKSWRQSENAETNKQLEVKATWMSYPYERTNRWVLPKMQPLFLFSYADGIVAFGGKTSTLPSLSTLLYSPDFGLTWKVNTNIALHSKMSGARGPLASAVDGENNIWVVTDAETWSGRLSR